MCFRGTVLLPLWIQREAKEHDGAAFSDPPPTVANFRGSFSVAH